VLRIRLARLGTTHRPFYRFVVSESTRRPEARNVDELGYYDPRRRPPVLRLDVARAEAWIRKGAVASERFATFLKKEKARTAAR
jgi:small subunit ribosomal protein S16